MHVIAYGGSKVRAAIAAHQNIRVHIIPELCALYQARCESSEVANEEGKSRNMLLYMCRSQLVRVLPRSLALILKAGFQALMLLIMMIFWLPSPDTLLLQVCSSLGQLFRLDSICRTCIPTFMSQMTPPPSLPCRYLLPYQHWLCVG